MYVGEDQVFGSAPQHRVGALLVVGEDEELGTLQTADQQVPHLGRGLAAGQPVDVDAAHTQKLPQAVLFDARFLFHRRGGRRSDAVRRSSRGRGHYYPNESRHPLPALRASSSWYSIFRPVLASRLTS